ncbi:MAG: ribosome maturation factor RimM [Actinomycetota bacterium]|nr:ribosome maturation factor RimM [Actinomycetota bacterium]
MLRARKKASLPESNSSTESASVRAGRLGRPHGLDGFLGLYVEPEDLVYFEIGSIVHIQDRPHVVRAVRRADKGHQVAFKEVTNRDGAEKIRNLDVMVASRRELSEGEFWPDQLTGLAVRPGGGTVVGVAHGPGQDRLVVDRDGLVFEVPFVNELVPVVDIDEGYVEVVEIDGLTESSDR